MSGEERLPEERWRRVGISGSLKGRRLKEMTQSITSFSRGLLLLSTRPLLKDGGMVDDHGAPEAG